MTTHDLALTAITDALGPRAENVHFTDYLTDGKLRFDYKMQPGVVGKGNALELMRAAGFEIERKVARGKHDYLQGLSTTMSEWASDDDGAASRDL